MVQVTASDIWSTSGHVRNSRFELFPPKAYICLLMKRRIEGPKVNIHSRFYWQYSHTRIEWSCRTKKADGSVKSYHRTGFRTMTGMQTASLTRFFPEEVRSNFQNYLPMKHPFSPLVPHYPLFTLNCLGCEYWRDHWLKPGISSIYQCRRRNRHITHPVSEV